VVQEDVTEDVFETLTLNQENSGDGHDYAEKIRTRNVLDSNGYMEAIANWKEMHQNESYVVAINSSNMLLDGWDCAVVDSLRGTPATTVVTAPGSGTFPVLLYGSAQCRSAPAVHSVSFPALKHGIVPVVAASHQFWAMHGSSFSALQPPRQFVPLYLTDVVLSSYLFAQNFRFVTPPQALFRPRATSSTDHLFAQRPRSWRQKYTLATAYCTYAGIRRVEICRSRSRSRDRDRRRDRDRSRSRSRRRSRGRDRDRDRVRVHYELTERAMLGLLEGALLKSDKRVRGSGEALQKYGSSSEITRRRMLVRRLTNPF
jgi:hypothetical protein